jgi:hypothetical protein
VKKRNLILPVLLGAGIALSGCGSSVDPDHIVLEYSGGSVEGGEFKKCTEPTKVTDAVVNDKQYYIPTSERTWNITPSGGDSNEPIISSSKPAADGQPGPNVKVWVKTDFFLNTNCDEAGKSALIKWWETLGKRYGADIDPNASAEDQSKDEGWTKMLGNTIVPIERSTIARNTKKFTADELDADLNGSWDALKLEVEKAFSEELNKNGKFFCGRGYDRKDKNSCPPITVLITGVDFENQAIADARANVFAAKQRAEAEFIEAQSKFRVAQELAKAAKANPAYIQLELARMQLEAAKACATNPNCTLVIGGNANVFQGK